MSYVVDFLFGLSLSVFELTYDTLGFWVLFGVYILALSVSLK